MEIGLLCWIGRSIRVLELGGETKLDLILAFLGVFFLKDESCLNELLST